MIKVRDKLCRKKTQRAIYSLAKTQAIQDRAFNLKIKKEMSVTMEKFLIKGSSSEKFSYRQWLKGHLSDLLGL